MRLALVMLALLGAGCAHRAPTGPRVGTLTAQCVPWLDDFLLCRASDRTYWIRHR